MSGQERPPPQGQEGATTASPPPRAKVQATVHIQTHSPGSSCHSSAETSLTSIHEDAGSSPGLTQWVKGFSVAVSCGVDHRHGSDLTLLWLWCRLAAAAPIRPLAWELPCAGGVALKRQKQTNKQKTREREKERERFSTDLLHDVITLFCVWHAPWHVEVPGPRAKPTQQQ